MEKKKAKKSTGETKQAKETKFVKLGTLSQREIGAVNLDDLWIIKPESMATGGRKPKPKPRKLCGCRNVCLA